MVTVRAIKDGGFVGIYCNTNFIHLVVRDALDNEDKGVSHTSICYLIKFGRQILSTSFAL